MSRKQAQTENIKVKKWMFFCAFSALVLTYSSPSFAVLPPKQTESLALRALKQIQNTTSDITQSALGMIGVRYKRGGNTIENGLDCSGFVKLVFKNASAAELPRTAKEMSQEGELVEKSDLKPGDLVFFNTLRRSFSHVGIYLGDNKFIHSPSAGGKVRVESMTVSYWKNRFNGARRITENQSQK